MNYAERRKNHKVIFLLTFWWPRLTDDLSAGQDSFSNGLLDCPHYTRPECFEGSNVPEVLLSGDHERIRRWRLEQSIAKTGERRPDLMNQSSLKDR